LLEEHEMMRRIRGCAILPTFVLTAALLAAGPRPAAAGLYQLTPLDLGSGVSVTGTVATDGTIGALSAGNFTAWNITVTLTTVDLFNSSNSRDIFSALTVTADGRAITVANPDGSWAFFKGPLLEPTVAQLADFTDPTVPGGQAAYISPFTSQMLSPLSNDANYMAAHLANPAGASTTSPGWTWEGGSRSPAR
jgi:hypothetical protein